MGEWRSGVGIGRGRVVCGNGGGPDQMEAPVISGTVNLSARLTSLAGPGEVWVSEATARAAPALTFSALPEVKVKGKGKGGVWRYGGFGKGSGAGGGYFQVVGLNSVKKLEITNNLLYELYDSEISIMRAKVGGVTKSTKLEYPATQSVFEW